MTGRPCLTCTHPQRLSIELALVRREDVSTISTRFGIAARAVYRHQQQHMASVLAAPDGLDRERFGEEIRLLQQRTITILEEAERSKRLGTAVNAIREARANVELAARLSGALDERPQVNVLITSPEWLALRGRILDALGPYPEALTALYEALA